MVDQKFASGEGENTKIQPVIHDAVAWVRLRVPWSLMELTLNGLN